MFSTVFVSTIIMYGLLFFFFFKQKTAYEMRISDWSSDVCSSDLTQRVRFNLDIQMQAPREPLDDDVARVLSYDTVIADIRELTGRGHINQIGRASCRERVCQYVKISVVAVSLKKKTTI